MRMLLPSVALCLLVTGCSEESQAAGKEALDQAGKDLEQAGQELQEAGKDLADLMKLGRDAFTQAVEQQLADLEAKIEELKAKGGAETEAAMEKLAELRQDAAERIDELRKAGGDAWRDLREGVAGSLEDLRQKVQAQKTKDQSGTDQKDGGR